MPPAPASTATVTASRLKLRTGATTKRAARRAADQPATTDPFEQGAPVAVVVVGAGGLWDVGGAAVPAAGVVPEVRGVPAGLLQAARTQMRATPAAGQDRRRGPVTGPRPYQRCQMIRPGPGRVATVDGC
jgi:hypothetical protein